jgi:hypothetical protein
MRINTVAVPAKKGIANTWFYTVGGSSIMVRLVERSMSNGLEPPQ